MLEIMARQQYLDQVPRYLCYNPYMKELQVTPAVPGTRVDAGALGTPHGRTAYCVMAMGSKDANMAVEN